MLSSLTSHQISLIQRLFAAKERLLNAISGLDPTAICTAYVIGDWTIKDIFGHIVSWNQEFRADILLIHQGQHPGYQRLISGEDDFNMWNEQWIACKRDWTWQRVQKDFDEDCQEAAQLISSLEPRDFRKRGVTPWKRCAVTRPTVPATADTETIETLVTYHWRHMNQHARMIERWRKQKDSHASPP
jgi:hypothetical protein